jgi:hypothetical protein
VEQKSTLLLWSFHNDPVQSKKVPAWIHKAPKIGENNPIQGNPSLKDRSLGFSPAHESACCDELVRAFFFHK